ncbi:hypothetical protein [Candidatus Xianfuyuplasma coldseepsis]|uniref:Uncharacterized protein n=1 Tax=Candidatus Xianfuyuplasma coldseepsis TaxID=2782163 RepID=A0A7L7KPP9_9MOLU|nr:hypothetical protein [Xianfuyuplasma coldseepsis]QMS84683.1 hypothetical protein G4Z02_02590 [Xianfuyuplasma coldseepsis]
MTKNTRFYFFNKTLLQIVVLFFVLSFSKAMIIRYLSDYDTYLVPLFIIINFIQVIAVIIVILIVGYYLFVGYRYVTSVFYRESNIPLHEAFFHGYLDLAYVYDRLKRYGNENQYDTKTKSIIITFDTKIYHIIVRDIFGRLEADSRSDSWYIVSKRRKQYGNVRYLKRRSFLSPLSENQRYINALSKQSDMERLNYVCLTGIRQNTFNHPQINTVYELESILQHESMM